MWIITHPLANVIWMKIHLEIRNSEFGHPHSQLFSPEYGYIWFVFYYFLESILYSLVYNMNLFSAIKMGGGGAFLWKHVATKCYHIFQCVFLNAKHDCRYHMLWELYKLTMYTKHKKIPYINILFPCTCTRIPFLIFRCRNL